MKDESVLSISIEILQKTFDMSLESWQCNEKEINSLEYSFEKRATAEKNFNRKQVIPYALIFNSKGELLHYQRCGSEKRLSGIFSAGIGGHINDKDEGNTLYNKIVNGLKREIAEEIGIYLNSERIELQGMINEDRSEIGLCHIGVVFKCQLSDEQLNFENEIGNPHWHNPSELDLSKFELWSALAVELVKEKRKNT